MRGVAVLTAVVWGIAVAPALADDNPVAVGPTSAFNPKTLEIDLGDTVTWTWSGLGSHSVTTDPNQSESFDSGVRSNGATFSSPQPFDTAGCVRYFCTIHGNTFGRGMSGVILVGGAAAGDCPQLPSNPPPPPPGTPPPPGAPPPGTPGSPADSDPPSFSSVKASPSAICTKKSDTCKKPGMVLTFRLDEAATVTGNVELLKLAKRSAKPKVVKRLRINGKAGSNTFRYSGRSLKAGRYRVRLSAKDKAGNESSLASVRFRVK